MALHSSIYVVFHAHAPPPPTVLQVVDGQPSVAGTYLFTPVRGGSPQFAALRSGSPAVGSILELVDKHVVWAGIPSAQVTAALGPMKPTGEWAYTDPAVKFPTGDVSLATLRGAVQRIAKVVKDADDTRFRDATRAAAALAKKHEDDHRALLARRKEIMENRIARPPPWYVPPGLE